MTILTILTFYRTLAALIAGENRDMIDALTATRRMLTLAGTE